jgi:isorenieratene synthase
VVGAGIAGLAAATGLAERDVPVVLVEREATVGGRVRSWAVRVPSSTGPEAGGAGPEAGGVAVTCPASMSRGFHAFFRQYYNLRALLRRADPGLEALMPLPDYPLQLAGGPRDSFARVPRTPPWSVAGFVATSPSFPLRGLRHVDVHAALGLLDVAFPGTWSDYDGLSAADVLDRLRFPDESRHLALEVFARSFFADPADFSGGELVAMFHAYFVGSAEGLLFDVPAGPYDEALWQPLVGHLTRLGVDVRTDQAVRRLGEDGDGLRVELDDGTVLEAAQVVLATDRAALQDLVGTAGWLGDDGWRARLAALRPAPPFAVWRLWLDRAPAPGSPPFLGTSGYGPLDNVSFIDRMEPHARSWAARTGGSVVELHAYALPEVPEEEELRAALRRELERVHPELVGARVVHDEWLLRRDCPLVGIDPWSDRPGVTTPDPRVVLAGDGIRCDYPVALMERAATTGWLAANTLLQRRGLPGHELWTVPLQGRGRRWAHASRRVIEASRHVIETARRRQAPLSGWGRSTTGEPQSRPQAPPGGGRQ